MKTYLKMKIKSLAAEARIIRQEEKKWPGGSEIREGLHNHRIFDVRHEARAAQLAYGFLRGRRYRQIEENAKMLPWTAEARAATLIVKYGQYDSKSAKAAFTAWLTEEESSSKAA